MKVELSYEEIKLLGRAMDCLISESPKAELSKEEFALYDKFIELEIEAHG